jgi:hypothetical protein
MEAEAEAPVGTSLVALLLHPEFLILQLSAPAQLRLVVVEMVLTEVTLLLVHTL